MLIFDGIFILYSCYLLLLILTVCFVSKLFDSIGDLTGDIRKMVIL